MYFDKKLQPARAIPLGTPLDADRVVAVNPREVRYWCNEFGCTESQLRGAVARVGERVTDVRRELLYNGDSSMDSWNK